MLHSHGESDRVVSILSNYGLVLRAVVVVLFDATIMLLPITLAIGLLRYRLFDIEVVLGKSLAYGALWLAISGPRSRTWGWWCSRSTPTRPTRLSCSNMGPP